MTIVARAMRFFQGVTVALGVSAAGCESVHHIPAPAQNCLYSQEKLPIHSTAPRELIKVILPPYRIEPPDVLQIDAIHVVPRSPYRLRMLDSLVIHVTDTLPDALIAGQHVIEPGGLLNLGYPYGRVRVSGMTVDEARTAIEVQLKQTLRQPGVSVGLGEIGGKQQISGQHLVAPDGTVTLGGYGNVLVIGQTLPKAKASIEGHLSQFLEDPEVSVDVYAYNSKNYYVITQGAGLGDGVNRLPITGNETVLDAISQINGLTSVSSSKIWIARPGCGPDGRNQIMPVDWVGLTQRGDPLTNYQLMPGDRVYVAEDKLVATDNHLAKLLSPVERILGVTLLGSGTVNSIRNGSAAGFIGF